jgi:hypothetical protein
LLKTFSREQRLYLVLFPLVIDAIRDVAGSLRERVRFTAELAGPVGYFKVKFR